MHSDVRSRFNNSAIHGIVLTVGKGTIYTEIDPFETGNALLRVKIIESTWQTILIWMTV